MGIVTETANELNLDTNSEVARLYKSKDARIKRDLNFITKANRSKIA